MSVFLAQWRSIGFHNGTQEIPEANLDLVVKLVTVVDEVSVPRAEARKGTASLL